MAASVQETAEAVRNTMLSNDRLTRAFGMNVLDIAPGTATVQMLVRDDMLNGYDVCHGGGVASLADSAFAFACNSHGELSVASAFRIDFVAPARAGDLLTAFSREVSKTGRLGVYDTEVTNQRGERVAVFRGRSYTAKGRSAIALK
jgi:acyl-CoA thioesterase